MIQYIDKAAVVAEIERLIAELVEEGEDTMFEQGRISAFEDVKVFINHTLEVKEVEEEPVSNDLEEAASQYPSIICRISPQWKSEVENVFKAGAQWQKEQMITKACVFLESTDFCKYYNREFIKEFKKAMRE